MIKNKFKNIVIYSVLFLPISVGIISCSSNRKIILNQNTETASDTIPSILGVAALGQLSPAGEIRQLAAPISQLGTSPRLTDILVKEGDFVKKGAVLAIFENREKLIAELEKKNNLIETNNLEIALKQDQIRRYEMAVEKDAYSLVELSQRKDELLKLKKQKINNIGDKKNIEIDLFNSKLRSPIDGYVLAVNTELVKGLKMTVS